MTALCQFIYNGHTGPRGKVCGRPEAEHCGEKFADHFCPPRPRKVHHVFTRKFKCPTCGSTEAQA